MWTKDIGKESLQFAHLLHVRPLKKKRHLQDNDREMEERCKICWEVFRTRSKPWGSFLWWQYLEKKVIKFSHFGYHCALYNNRNKIVILLSLLRSLRRKVKQYRLLYVQVTADQQLSKKNTLEFLYFFPIDLFCAL